jgi:hypothetical protein
MKYKLICTRKECYRRVRSISEMNCTITIDGIDMGMCKSLQYIYPKKKMVPKYIPLPLGQVVYTLLQLKTTGKKISTLDEQMIDDFISWMNKRFHRCRVMKTINPE